MKFKHLSLLVVALAGCKKDPPSTLPETQEADVCAGVTCDAYAVCDLGVCAPLLETVVPSIGTIAFEPSLATYTIDVDLSVSELTLTATVADGAILTIDDVATPSGLASDPITLGLGTTSIAITVTLGDQSVTYTIDVVRAGEVRQQAYLKASNAGFDDELGHAVVIDGDTLVVGAHKESSDGSSPENDDATYAGAAYVFVRSGTAWVQQAYLKAANIDIGDTFGWRLALEGDTLVISAYTESGDAASTAQAPNNNATFAGAVYVFARSGSTWTQEAYLKASNAESNDIFGYALALDGDTLAVGTPYESGDATSTAETPNDSAHNAGAVYVFERSGTSWLQKAYLKASNAEAGAYFGLALALEDDRLVVGAPSEDGSAASTGETPDTAAANAGAAYVFARSAGTWTQQAYLKASNAEAQDYFGCAVALDGDTLALGALGEAGSAASTAEAPDNLAAGAGAVYVFVNTGDAWTQTHYVKATNASEAAAFGSALGLESGLLAVGAYNESGDATSSVEAPNAAAAGAGAAYVFAREAAGWTQFAYVKASNAGDHDQFGIALALDGTTLVVGANQEDGDASSTAESPNDDTEDAGAMYVFTL